MSAERNRAAIERYLSSKHADLSMMADDVTFTNTATGEEHRGRDGVAGMLQWIYHVAFEADAEPLNVVVDDKHAVLEAVFFGKHIGEFAGIAATGRDVRVPLCVCYDMDQGLILRGRVYMAVTALMQQLTQKP